MSTTTMPLGVTAVMLPELDFDEQIALCRELTKKFEQVRHAPLAALADSAAQDPPRGEIVVLIGPAPERSVNPSDIESALRTALQVHSVRDAADSVSAELGLPRRQVYQLALKLEKGD